MDKLPPVENRQQLVDWLAAGSRPPEQWRMGTEHEKFGFQLDDLRPLSYEGDQGIRAMLEGLTRYGWQPVLEGGNPIALTSDDGSITLEPGGQLELSGALRENVHQTCDEVHRHLAQVKAVANELGIGFLGMGFQPKWGREDIDWMPKARYKIMRQYMPQVGRLGIDMMIRTCTVQTNLDFGSEADMVKKFRVSLALQPVATALFANSPFTDGKPNGYLSYRSYIWTQTDPNRTGMLPFVFEDGMGFEGYVDYMLDVPMYFVMRDGRYVDAAGQSFRDFLSGKLPALPGEKPTMHDWEDHLTTVFPEVRLKRFLEMRGADGGPWGSLCALPAFWVGLLYDSSSLDAAWDLVSDWTEAERAALRATVPEKGLTTPFRNETLREIAIRTLEIAAEGLRARGQKNRNGNDERVFLNPLQETAESGLSPADVKLSAYHERWNGSVDPLFKEYAY